METDPDWIRIRWSGSKKTKKTVYFSKLFQFYNKKVSPQRIQINIGSGFNDFVDTDWAKRRIRIESIPIHCPGFNYNALNTIN
jgi:hypothetical protein